MATLETADGRLLRSSGPAGGLTGGRFLPSSFPPLWSDGERHGGTHLKSFEQIYRSQPVVAGVIDKIARRAATLPVGVFTKLDNGSREAVPQENGLATLLRRPRPRVAGTHLLTHIFQSLLIHGNAVVAKLRGPDRDSPPVMLWPLDWAQLSAYGEPGGDIEWWSTYQFGGVERFLAVEDTIHFAWPGPDGGMVGVSPLEKLGVTIQVEDAAQRTQSGTFATDYRPSLAITLGTPKPSRELLEMTRASIDALRRSGDKTILLGSDSKVETLSMTPVEAALIDQRRLNREEVAIVFDLAGPSLSDTTNASLGNVVERMRSFYRDVLPPWTTLVVDTLESQLVEPESAWMGALIRFDFSDKLRGEPMEQANTLKTLVDAGLLTRNEARYELGEPPEDADGATNPADRLTVAANNQDLLSNLANPDSASAE